MGELGFETMAALEYEIRLWDGDGRPMSSGISYSLVEIGRFKKFVDRLDPDLLEQEAGDVLGTVNVADLRIGRHLDRIGVGGEHRIDGDGVNGIPRNDPQPAASSWH